VAALTQAIASQLHGADPEEAELELDRLAAEATRVRNLKTAKDSDIGSLQEKIDECRESSREMAQETARVGQIGLSAEEDELAGFVQRAQLGEKQAAEERAQHPHRQQEGRPR
jgi:hypothetical protein